jgi:hypothetical protein
MKKFKKLSYVLFLFIIFTACESTLFKSDSDTDDTDISDTQPYSSEYNNTVDEAMSANVKDHEDVSDYYWNDNNTDTITLNDDVITASGSAVTVDGSTATITAGGNYSLSGTLNDGRIIVDSNDSLTVRLILKNVNIKSTTNAPISVVNAEKTVIILADQSDNYITDGSNYVFDNPEDDEPNATIFSKDDLSIYGNGTLTIDANYNDGLSSKDGLVLNGATININAVDDGIHGKDYIVVKSGIININAGGDGLKSNNDEEEDKGYVLIENGELDLTCSADAIDAETDALIRDGTFNMTTGGGSKATVSGDNSAKGIKGNKWVIIDGGNFNINSADDALHSNTSIVINKGDYTISTGDDGVHGDVSVVINDGSISIMKSVEGVESNMIAVTGGVISVIASDDCFNSTAGQRTEANDKSCTYIYGGYVVLNTSRGDGLDSNGSIVMTGGTVIIHGPSSDPEVMFDYNGTFNISGGLLTGSGSGSRMTQTLSSSSKQNSLIIMFKSFMNASTIIHIEDSNGNDVLTFQPLHRYQSFVFSSGSLVNGKKYTAYVGGTSSGGNTDGLYSEGTYSGGTQIITFTVSETITVIM